MAIEDFKSLNACAVSKHPTNQTNIELFRKARSEAAANVSLVTKKIASLNRVLRVAEMQLQQTERAYENALANQGKPRATRSYLNQAKPKKAQLTAPRSELPKCSGSMVAMMLGC